LSFSSSILAGLFGVTAISAHGRFRKGNWKTAKTRKPRRAGNSPRNSVSKRRAPLRPLGQVRQRGGKIVQAYALEGTLDVSTVRSNEITIEWPPRSGRTIYVPEIDRAAWFALPLARSKILASQRPFLDRLAML
jgi:predicted NUDIX family NTP pyrophosphohydrolase